MLRKPKTPHAVDTPAALGDDDCAAAAISSDDTGARDDDGERSGPREEVERRGAVAVAEVERSEGPGGDDGETRALFDGGISADAAAA